MQDSSSRADTFPRADSRGDPYYRDDHRADAPVTLADLKHQEKLFHKLISTQESDFKTFMSVLIDGTNRRVDEFLVTTTREIIAIKTSLEAARSDIDAMKDDVTYVKKMSPTLPDGLEERIKTIQKKHNKLEYQVEELDAMSRKNSLDSKLDDSANETWVDTENDLMMENISADVITEAPHCELEPPAEKSTASRLNLYGVRMKKIFSQRIFPL